ncbi:MAG: 2-C-methyl-D-erythritol 4-phosphate cytidylyltransferase [Phycisphaerales bacterium]|jgi:2-C-methyl-D-erythritol 4-phosphate cytidylyltransferase|nr:2-C-methyl-D-erythritol 4-phosphate cytidylyltransferase [Phycisphaerales bacterium]
MKTVSVILPAAGSGKRFGAETNKIFHQLDGREIFLRTIDLFSGRDEVRQILLIASAGDIAELSARFGAELESLGVELVQGGAERSDSVRNALAKLAPSAELVCIHDAVRPCALPDRIDAVFQAAAETRAAMLACPLHGTIKKVDPSGRVLATVDRDGLWEAQTPQVFEKSLLIEAYAQGGGATDDAEMVQRTGAKVTVVQSGPNNIKITAPQDVMFAEAVIKHK